MIIINVFLFQPTGHIRNLQITSMDVFPLDELHPRTCRARVE